MAKKKPSPADNAKRKAVPPPDNPQLRHQENLDLDSRMMAEKRLEALKKLRQAAESPEKNKQ